MGWSEGCGFLPKRGEGRTFEISFPYRGAITPRLNTRANSSPSQTKPGRRERNRTPDGCGTKMNPTTPATAFAVEQPHRRAGGRLRKARSVTPAPFGQGLREGPVQKGVLVEDPAESGARMGLKAAVGEERRSSNHWIAAAGTLPSSSPPAGGWRIPSIPTVC